MLAGCNGPPGTTAGADSSKEACEGAALEYRGVCFHTHSVEAMGWEHPLELDGKPGHELVGISDERVTVHRFDGDGFFALVGKAAVPADSIGPADAITGEFDEISGLDLVVTASGQWAALYHLDDEGAPTLAGQRLFDSNTRAFERPVAVGPDASGRWRIVAHFDTTGVFYSSDPLALWEVQGNTFVEVERLDLETGACEIYMCAGGEFDGDGRIDAVCTLEDVCPNEPPENDVVHVILLAQADGTVTTAMYPTHDVLSSIAADLDGDHITDLVGDGGLDTIWYRLGDGTGGLGPVTWVDPLGSAKSHWSLVSVGDLDGDGGAEVLLGDHLQALVFDDAVGAPQASERFEMNDGLEFTSWMPVPIDVNADNIVDLPMRERILLVSELRQ
jgi:hypothetical protein